MKKVLNLLLIVTITLIMPNIVDAANYEVKELIPINKKTTVRTENILYKDFQYTDGKITFDKIKNISSEEKNISVSIGLFDDTEHNIGIINYCSKDKKLIPKSEVFNYIIEVKKENISKDKTINDIKYISILSENSSCRTDGSLEFIGHKVEDIYKLGSNELKVGVKMLLVFFEILLMVIIITFLYQFLFTSRFKNIDGEDVRQEYTYINKELKKKRDEKEKASPPPIKEKKTNKTEKILKQEASEKENKSSKLHDFYK